MRKLIVFALMLSACEGSFAPKASLSVSNADSIIGGTEVSYADPVTQKVLSFKVLWDKKEVETENAIETTWKASQCTASAIAPRIILTAAHCISKIAEINRIEIPTEEGGEEHFNVIKTVVHPDYEKDKTSDLALLHLELALPERVQILSLPTKENPLTLTEVQAAGFGKISGRKDNPAGVGVLRKVDLTVVDFKLDAQIFSVDQTTGKGVCQGDSGGPAMVDVNHETYVVGVVSKTRYIPDENGNAEDICSYRGQYVNVQHYLDWIVPEMEKLSLE
ncbi:trypsin-like serine protease [Bdellovibrio bacteriovorus]|uniref:S1 family peptidase n=1 Tax=Bdellovibrio TaxID=958 RepID=UPI0035A908EB